MYCKYSSGIRVDTVEAFDNPREPSGLPGSRAPHLVVAHEGAQVSTVDLFAGRWVLAYGPRGQVWNDVLRRSTRAAVVPVNAYGIQPAGDPRDVDGGWSAAYGVDSTGAVLIRPDGFVAWRRHDAAGHAQQDLDRAVARVLADPAASQPLNADAFAGRSRA